MAGLAASAVDAAAAAAEPSPAPVHSRRANWLSHGIVRALRHGEGGFQPEASLSAMAEWLQSSEDELMAVTMQQTRIRFEIVSGEEGRVIRLASA